MKDRVRCVVNNKPIELISAHVEKNGTRAIDSGKFTFSRKSAVDKHDEVLYIQDVTNVKYLTGVWNFEYSTRDESGHSLDGLETDADKTTFTYVKDCDGICLQGGDISGSERKPPKIPDPRATTSSDFTIDFSQQFDILALIKGDDYPRQTKNGIFAKGDASNNIELYFTSSVNGSSNNDPNYARADIEIGGTTVSLGYGTSNASGTHTNIKEYGDGGATGEGAARGRYYWVRLYRDQNNLVKLEVNGNLEGSATITGNPNTTEPMYLGADRSGANVINSRMAQVRMYCGYYLTENEYDDLVKARISTEICKFGGNVWKIDEKTTHKVVHCKGFSDKLHNIEIKTGGTYPTNTNDNGIMKWTTGDDDIIKNEYKSKRGYEIIEDLIKVYNQSLNNLIVHTADQSKWDEMYNHYIATGTLYANLLLLSLNEASDTSFKITGRGVLLLETDDIDASQILFRQGASARIKDLGTDDSNVITQLTLISSNILRSHKRKVTSNDFSTDGSYYTLTSNKLVGKPISTKVTRNSNNYVLTQADQGESLFQHLNFRVNTNDKSITLAGALDTSSDGYDIEYTYEDVNDSSKFYTARDGDYATLGLYSKTYQVPQFVGTEGLATVATRIFGKFGKLNRRISISVPHLANHVRENYEVKVEAPQHGITTPETLSVMSIEYFYPEGRTIINIGEHQFDAFDLDKSFGEAISTQKSHIVTNMA